MSSVIKDRVKVGKCQGKEKRLTGDNSREIFEREEVVTHSKEGR